MLNSCDLHTHSINSDGELTVEELLKYANEKKLKKISITDHDNVDAYFDESINKFDGEIITGCEFVCKQGKQPIEILGYGIDVIKAKKYLDDFGFNQSKLDRMHCNQMISAFTSKGFDVSFDYDNYIVCKQQNMKHQKLYRDLMSNLEIRRYVESIDNTMGQTFNALYRKGLNNPNSVLFTDEDAQIPTAKYICQKIHEFEGLAFLAHPYQYGENMNIVLSKLKNDLDGVECYHYSCATDDKQKVLINFCKQNHLLISGGSDFHCVKDKQHCKDRLNELEVPGKYFDIIKNSIKHKLSQNL